MGYEAAATHVNMQQTHLLPVFIVNWSSISDEILAKSAVKPLYVPTQPTGLKSRLVLKPDTRAKFK